MTLLRTVLALLAGLLVATALQASATSPPPSEASPTTAPHPKEPPPMRITVTATPATRPLPTRIVGYPGLALPMSPR